MYSWDETIKYLLVGSTLTMCRKKEIEECLIVRKGRSFHCLWMKRTWQVCHIFRTRVKKADVKIKVSDSEIIV